MEMVRKHVPSSVAHFLLVAAQTYRRWFSVGEIEDSFLLKSAFGAVLFFFFLSFEKWMSSPLISSDLAKRGGAICWPFFQHCGDFYFLQTLPTGYSQSIFYMGLYAVMMLTAYLMWRGRWAWAHICMFPLLLWKLLIGALLAYTIMGPYDYYHITFVVILLFLPFKEYFLKLAVVMLYFLATTTKLDQTWVLGTYFTAMQIGLPIFPTSLTPLFTNLVIFMQLVGAWFLMGKNILLQRIVLGFFIIFHLYSGILVNYHYPSVIIPLLLILFGPFYKYMAPPVTRASIPGWIWIGVLVVCQIPGFIIPLPGDRRLTLEGNRYGMFMFEANHQCIATVSSYRTDIRNTGTHSNPLVNNATSCSGLLCLTQRTQYQDGETAVTQERYESASAWNRCDPHDFWAKYHTQCAIHPGISKIAFTFDHSINGGPFYRIVDVSNLCDVTYSATSHNPWIAIPPEAPIVGYPVKNIFRY